MRIAVTAAGENLDDPVYREFGTAPHFIIVEVISGQIKNARAIENIGGFAEGKEGRSAEGQLEDEGVEGIISDGFDAQTFHHLRNKGIKIFLADEGNVAYNLEMFVQGDLKPAEDIEDVGYVPMADLEKPDDTDDVDYRKMPLEESETADEDADMPATDQDEPPERSEETEEEV